MSFTFFTIHSRANLSLFALSLITRSVHVIATDTIHSKHNEDATVNEISSSMVIIHGLICIGQGADSTALGIIASIIILFLIGSFLWLTFAYLRPRFRELYAVREWFPPPENRSRPLRKSFWAFLFPQPPTSVSKELPDNISSKFDPVEFPSDEQLAQRTLWHTFIVVCFWSIVGLGGALPVYLVRTPCVAQVLSNDSFGGRFSTMQDLGVFRLLNLLDNEVLIAPDTQTRLIIVAVLVVAVVAVPSAVKFLYEFNRLTIHRRRWLDIKCGRMEMAWLSLANARGFAGWNESALKDYLVKIGLSQGFKINDENRSNVMPSDFTLRGSASKRKDDVGLEIDIQSLFSIVETSHLSQLIQERDVILNNLEVAEIQYINSFQLSTPLPSIIDYEAPTAPPPTEVSDLKHRISRPKALRSSVRRHAADQSHAHTIGSTPTTYLAPSSFYRLRDIRTSQLSQKNDDNLATRISQRVVGTRFQEAQGGSRILSRIFSWGNGSPPENFAGLGSMNPAHFSVEQLRHGPHEPLSGNLADNEVFSQDDFQSDTRLEPVTEEMQSDNNGIPPDSVEHNFQSRLRPRRQQDPVQLDRRSTFAMRLRPDQFASDTDFVPPPHLRLQSQRPFVRPVSGMNHDQLGIIYNSIREWRSRLKVINMEIAEAQQSCHELIANGNRIKGWLLIGRGLRHLPRVQMIEGRSKEDVLYGQLQIDIGGSFGQIILWCVICVIMMVSCGILIPVTSLIVSLGPGVAHYLSLFEHLNAVSTIGAGLVTTLTPALFTLLLIFLTLPIIHFISQTTGTVSASMAYIKGFKVSLVLLTAIYGLWLLGCGSVIFSLQPFATGSHQARAVADGLLYTIPFAIVLTFALTAIFPALWLIQPIRLIRILRRKKFTMTPRQRFRNLYPSGYDHNFVLACCYLPVILAAAFCIIFPIVGPPVCLLLFITVIGHRYLIGYVYIEAPQTGGLLQLWLLRRLANLMMLQPLILGLIILTRRLWILGGVLVGLSVLLLFCTESYAWFRLRLIQPNTLSKTAKDVLLQFSHAAQTKAYSYPNTEEYSMSDIPLQPPRSSVASVLEMMSITLAVVPPSLKRRGPIPLPSETIDDLTATETAARTNPAAPPRLPPLPFMTHTEEVHSILYAPELIAPSPIIWLPNDSSGVAETEAIDLFRYHGLQTTLDIGAIQAV